MSLTLPSGMAWRGRCTGFIAGCIAHDVAFGRLVLLLPAIGAAGIAMAAASPVEVPPEPLAAVLAALVLARRLAGRSHRLAVLAGPLLAIAALAAGALALAVQERVAGTAVILRAQTVRLEGVVMAVEPRGTTRQSLVVAPLTGSFRGPAPRRVRLSVRGDTSFRVGETVAATARLFPLQGPVYPGGYDSSRRLYFDGIGATGFTYGPPKVIAPAPRWSLAAMIDRLRTGIAGRIEAALEPERAALAEALLVGRRGSMPQDDIEALRISGLGHILAISGLHMALVAGSVFAALRFAMALVPRLALGAPIRKLAATGGLLAATFYLAVSGGSVATVRAFVMLAIAFVAILADRPALTMRTVAVAAVLVMALDPVSVTEPSFQMSFLAVVALVGAYEWWSRRKLAFGHGWTRPIAAFVIGLAMTSFIAGLATLPASAYHFHRLAPLGLIANLLAMPVMTLVAMPAGVVALAVMPLGLETWPLAVMGEGLAIILVVAHHAADATGSSGLVGAVPSYTALLGATGLVWLAVSTAPWRLAGAALIAAGLALAPFGPRHDLLVAEDGETVAVRAGDGRLAFAGDADGFLAQLWLSADGDPRPPDKALLATRCDPLGCTLAFAQATTVAIPASPRALGEDCRLAAAVVSRLAVDHCTAPLVIDRRDLMTHGAVAATREGDTWRVRHARPHGPTRRWQVPADVARD